MDDKVRKIFSDLLEYSDSVSSSSKPGEEKIKDESKEAPVKRLKVASEDEGDEISLPNNTAPEKSGKLVKPSFAGGASKETASAEIKEEPKHKRLKVQNLDS